MTDQPFDELLAEAEEYDDAPRSRRRRGVPRAVAALVVIVLFFGVTYAALAALSDAPAVAGEAETELTATSEAAEPLNLPNGAIAAAVAVVGTEEAIDSIGAEEQLPMASITKLITALTVLEHFPIEPGDDGQMLTMGQADIDFFWTVLNQGGSLTDVRGDEDVSQRDLLERVIVVSSGNAAMTLAHWAFGSQEEFVAAANAWAESNGLTETIVADASGLSADSRATAADMAELGRIAYSHPVVGELMGLEQITVQGLTMTTTNPMHGRDGVVGGKTGMLYASGANLLLAAERSVEGMMVPVISVVVGVTGTATTSATSASMLQQAYSRFDERVVLPRGTVVGEYRPEWSDQVVNATTTEDLTALTWPGVSVQVAVLLDEVAPGTLSPTPGNATVSTFGQTHSVDLTTDGVIGPPDLLWRLGQPQLAINWVRDLF